jgi:hypothetical protein
MYISCLYLQYLHGINTEIKKSNCIRMYKSNGHIFVKYSTLKFGLIRNGTVYILFTS